MRCIVTAGPTYEELDQVRRLTNFSTGRLGSELASFLTERGHSVTLLLGYYSTWREPQPKARVQTFTTTANLRNQFQQLASAGADAIFHAAAVSDFGFGKIWFKSGSGELEEVRSGKISTRAGQLFAELVPTPKIISSLREWYPQTRIVGWKYEVDGRREDVLEKAHRQLTDCKTDACIANGPAYGVGFGIVTSATFTHFAGKMELFAALERVAIP